MHTSQNQRPRRRRRVGRVAAVVPAVSLLLASPPVSAETTRIEFGGTQQVLAVADPGTEWQSGPVLHFRDRVFTGVSVADPASGLPTGTTTAVVNVNLDTRDAHGTVWGHGRLDFEDGGFRTTFSGTIRPAAVPGGLLGEYQIIAHGDGAYDGMQIRADAAEFLAIGFGTYEAVLMTPGG